MGSFLRKRAGDLEDLHEAMATSGSEKTKLLGIANTIGLICHEAKVQLDAQKSMIMYYRTGRGQINDFGKLAMSREEADRAKKVLDEIKSFEKLLDAFSSKVIGLSQ